jgi:Domain of unknown function (DUF1707)
MSPRSSQPSGYTPRPRLGPPQPVGIPGPAASRRTYPAGKLRVSDADRDAVLAELSQHFQAGRLTAEELDDRTSQILAARTGTDLDGPLRDLPVLDAPGPGARPAPGPGSARTPAPRITWRTAFLPVAAVAAFVVMMVVLVVGVHGHQDWPHFLPVLPIIVVLRRLARRHGRF